jgi:hypothetical protein
MPRAHARADTDHLHVLFLIGDDLVEQRHDRAMAAVHDRQPADLHHIELGQDGAPGDSVAAITALSTRDSRISRDTTCCAPAMWRGCSSMRFAFMLRRCP